MSPNSTIAIIGAGVAGASAARALSDGGRSVVVFDKGREPGGRATTRVRGGDHYDHGAQYFTARDPAFLRQVQAWQRAGVVAAWSARLAAIEAGGRRGVTTDETRWVGVPGMQRLAADLLTGLDVRCSSRVQSCERHGEGWWIHLRDQPAQGPYATLLCTLPAPQAAVLLGTEPLAEVARAVEFAPCWALLAQFASALAVDFDAAFVNAGPLSWIARDSAKPGRPSGERWVVHAGAEFSRRHLEAEVGLVATELLREFLVAIEQPAVEPVAVSAHRWRYALAQPPLNCGALVDPARRLALGGDWCNGSRIEGAWLSGQALARHAANWIEGD